MTNAEAIARIANHMMIKLKEPRAVEITEAFKMAIDALKEKDRKENSCYQGQAPGRKVLFSQRTKDMLLEIYAPQEEENDREDIHDKASEVY